MDAVAISLLFSTAMAKLSSFGIYGLKTRLDVSSSEEVIENNVSMISRTLDMTVGLTLGDTMQS